MELVTANSIIIPVQFGFRPKLDSTPALVGYYYVMEEDYYVIGIYSHTIEGTYLLAAEVTCQIRQWLSIL